MTARAEVPYDRLGRDTWGARYRWWRPVGEVALFTVIALPLVAVTVFVGSRVARTIRHAGPGDAMSMLFMVNVMSAILLPAVLAAVALSGRGPGALSGVAGRVRRRWLGACAARALVVTVPVVLVWLATEGGWQPERWPGAEAWWPVAGFAVVAVPVAVAGRLYLLGWLLQVFGAWTGRRWPAVVLTTCVLVAFYWAASWPEVDLQLVASDVLVGLVVCWLTIRTGGLEAALGLYAVDALAIELLAQSQWVPGTPYGALLDHRLFALASVLAVLAYTWWTVRAASSRAERQPAGQRPL